MNDMELTFMDAMLYAMEGENPSKAIENQEKRGQQMVVRNQRLPRRMNAHTVPEKYRMEGVKPNMDWTTKLAIIDKKQL